MSGGDKGVSRRKSGVIRGKSKISAGYLPIQDVLNRYELSYKQVYRLIRNDLIRHEKINQSNTRPKFYVCEEDIIDYLGRNKVHAEDYERLRAEKLAVEIRLKKLKEQEYIEEIKAQEEAKFIRTMQWVFGDMKSWPDIFEFTTEQRTMWNVNLDQINERLEEVA